MKSQIQNQNIFNRVTWWAFIAFLVVFPSSDGFGIKNHTSNGAIDLGFLIAFVVLLGTVMLIRRTQDHSHVSHRPSLQFGINEWLLTIFVALSFFATLHSVNLHQSIFGIPGEYGGLISILAYGILFLGVSFTLDAHRHRQIVFYMVVGSIAPSIYGILQHIHGVPGIHYLPRITSFFCNADFCGTYFALAMLLTITLYLSTSKSRLLPYLILLVLQFVALMFSSTRSAWLGGIIGGLFFFLMAVIKKQSTWKKLLLLAVILFASFAIINHQSHNQVATRAKSIASNAQQVMTNHNINYAGSSRWYIWRESLPLILHHPLLGTGPDTFETVFQPPHGGAIKYLDGQPIANANNAYIQKAVTLGIPAGLASLLLFLRVPYQAWRKRNSMENSQDEFLSMGLIAVTISYLIQAFFNMDVVMVAPMFWIVLGMLNRRTYVK